MESSLERFVGYQKSLVLFDLVVGDINDYLSDRQFDRLAGQQLSSSDSVCANIEEGYGRASRVEYRRFLSIARGSLRETRGRFLRLRHWIPASVVEERIRLADEISRILTATMSTLQK